MKGLERTRIIDLFKKGLSVEVPKGSMTTSEVLRVLEKSTNLVYRENGIIQGFISFTNSAKAVDLEFIYVHKQRHGVGTLLVGRVAKYAIKNKLIAINSEVSVLDRRANGFYSSLGFKKTRKINYFLYKISAKPSTIMANVHRSKSR